MSFIQVQHRFRFADFLFLKELEVLLGSTSLASTLSTIFGLGVIGRKEIGLILLWALSPLAGQASLRVLDLKNVTSVPSIAFPWFAISPGYVDTSGVIQESSEEQTERYNYLLESFRPAVDDGVNYIAAQDPSGR